MWVLEPFQRPLRDVAPGERAAATQPANARWLLTASNGTSIGRPAKMGGTTGKADVLIFGEGSISIEHARIRIDSKDGVAVCDCSSKYGTYLQRGSADAPETRLQPQEWTPLAHGDVLRFGTKWRCTLRSEPLLVLARSSGTAADMAVTADAAACGAQPSSDDSPATHCVAAEGDCVDAVILQALLQDTPLATPAWLHGIAAQRAHAGALHQPDALLGTAPASLRLPSAALSAAAGVGSTVPLREGERDRNQLPPVSQQQQLLLLADWKRPPCDLLGGLVLQLLPGCQDALGGLVEQLGGQVLHDTTTTTTATATAAAVGRGQRQHMLQPGQMLLTVTPCSRLLQSGQQQHHQHHRSPRACADVAAAVSEALLLCAVVRGDAAPLLAAAAATAAQQREKATTAPAGAGGEAVIAACAAGDASSESEADITEDEDSGSQQQHQLAAAAHTPRSTRRQSGGTAGARPSPGTSSPGPLPLLLQPTAAGGLQAAAASAKRKVAASKNTPGGAFVTMDTRAAGSPSKRKRRKVDDDTATASLKQFGSAVHSPGAWRQYHKKQQQQQQQVTGDAPQQQPEQSIISVPLIVEAAAVEQLPSAAAAAAARTNAADGVNYKAFRRKHSSTGQQQQQQQQQTLPPASFVVRLLPYDRPVVADMNEYLKDERLRLERLRQADELFNATLKPRAAGPSGNARASAGAAAANGRTAGRGGGRGGARRARAM